MRRAGWALALLAGVPAHAQEGEPRFCPNRPDLGASGCVTEAGRVQAEVSGVDWQRTDDGETREDELLAGDLLLRIGLGGDTEAQLGWTSFGTVRMAGGDGVMRESGTGDVRLAIRHSLAGPDGKGLSIGIEPFVTLPLGRRPVGEGDWGAGVVLPLTYDVSDAWTAGFTGQLEAAVDEDGDGRHLAFSVVFGLQRSLGAHVSASAELSLERDRDPAGAATIAIAAGSIAWQPTGTTQLDLLAAAGLNRDSPDVRLVLGGAALF